MSFDVSILHGLRSRDSLFPLLQRSRGPLPPYDLTHQHYTSTCLRRLPSHFYHLLLGHTGCVNAVAVSPGSGQLVATGGDDLRVLLWNPYQTTKEVYPTQASTIRVSPYSPSGVGVPRAGFISPPFLQSYSGHSANIFGLTFSPDSTRLLSCGLDAQIHMYDVATGVGVGGGGDDTKHPSSRSFIGHQSSVHRLSFQTDNSNIFLSGSNDHTVRLWDIRTENRAQFIGSVPYAINSIACSPTDANQFVTAGKSLLLHDLRRMTPTAHNATAREESHRHARTTGGGAPVQTRAQRLAARLRARTQDILDRPDDESVGSEEMAELTQLGHQVRESVANAIEEDERAETEEKENGADDAGDDGIDSDDEDDFASLVELIVTGGSSARPLASLTSFDLSRQMPLAPVLPKKQPTRKSQRMKTPPATPATNTRGDRTNTSATPATSTGRNTRSRSRSQRAQDEEHESGDDDAQLDSNMDVDDSIRPSRRRTPSRGRSSRGRGRGAARGRGGRGRGGRPAAAAASRDSSSHDDDDDDDDVEDISPVPLPPCEASSAEYSDDGKSLVVCMMEGKPMVFDVSRREPVLCLESVNAFAGYSNTCTMKSATFCGPDDRFVMAGSDNFGIYLWDRTLLAQDILASPSMNPDNVATFLNPCKIIRGHRSVPNNQRYHPTLKQIYSCGVEKVVRVFHCTRPALTTPHVNQSSDACGDAASSSAQYEDGDILPEPTSIESGSAYSKRTPTPERSHKRKIEGHEIDTQNQGEEKKSRITHTTEEETLAEQEKRQTSIDVDNTPCDEDVDAAPSCASASESLRPRRRAAVAADAALAASSGPRRRSARLQPATAPSSSSSAIEPTPAAPAAPTYDPVYRMVRTYFTPRHPYTRLQCAFVLSGGTEWALGHARSMFADGFPEPIDEDDGAGPDSMAEDRQCIAQFDLYLHHGDTGDLSDEDDDDDSDDDDDDDDSSSTSSSDSDGSIDSDTLPLEFIVHLTPEQIAELQSRRRERRT